MFTSVIQSDKNKTCRVLNSNILMAKAYFLLVVDIRKRKRQLFEYLERSEFLFQNYDSLEGRTLPKIRSPSAGLYEPYAG